MVSSVLFSDPDGPSRAANAPCLSYDFDGPSARMESLPVSARMRAATVDDFGFEQTVDRLGQSIIVTFTNESGAVQDRK